MDRDNVAAMHSNGVHVKCSPAKAKWNDGTSRACDKAGKVERFHGHDFEGPLWDACGCDED